MTNAFRGGSINSEQAKNILANIAEAEQYELAAIYDPQGVYLYASEGHYSLLGYHPADLVGRRLSELIHEDDLTHAMLAYSDAELSGKSVEIGVRFMTKDRQALNVRARAVAVHDSLANLDYIVGLCRVVGD